MSWFKFLQRGAIGPISGFAWPANVWVETQGPLAVCHNGAHVLRPEDLAHWMHEELWRVEIEGDWIEGGDCVVARRARLVERIDAWAGGDGERFARACLDRIETRLAEATDPIEREHFGHYQAAVGRHVARKNAAMAGYVSALGIAQKACDEAPIERFRRERAWQSDWLVREMRLV